MSIVKSGRDASGCEPPRKCFRNLQYKPLRLQQLILCVHRGDFVRVRAPHRCLPGKQRKFSISVSLILKIFQSKVLRIITDAPWCVPNAVIKSDVQVLSVRQVRNYSVTYRQKLQCHLPTETTVSPTDRNHSVTYRQKPQCHLPTEISVTYRQKLQSRTDRNHSVTYRQKLQCHLPTNA